MNLIAGAPSHRTLSDIGEDVLAGVGRRNLELLRKIEVTIDGLCYDQTFFGGIAQFARKLEEYLRAATLIKPIDEDGKGEESLLRAQAETKKYYDALIRRRESARRDPAVTEEDGLVDAFTSTIAVVAELHNAVNDLRWAVGEHDANFSPRAQDCIATSPEALAKHLDAL